MSKRPSREVISTKRRRSPNTNNYEYTFVQNSLVSEEIMSGAKASSVASTDKRSQASSDEQHQPRREYVPIT